MKKTDSQRKLIQMLVYSEFRVKWNQPYLNSPGHCQTNLQLSITLCSCFGSRSLSYHTIVQNPPTTGGHDDTDLTDPPCATAYAQCTARSS